MRGTVAGVIKANVKYKDENISKKYKMKKGLKPAYNIILLHCRHKYLHPESITIIITAVCLMHGDTFIPGTDEALHSFKTFFLSHLVRSPAFSNRPDPT